jgi:TRAP-type C4-dicarboxylate transport system permease small subunit
MDSLLGKILKTVTKVLDLIGGAALTFMMLLTVTDVLMRAFGHPLIGTFEVVAMSLALVIGFTIPKVSFDRGHVRVDMVIERVSPKTRRIMNIFTRLICLGLFLIISYNLFGVANELRTAGEVSPTIQLPSYPFAYGVAVCCCIECLVFVQDIIKIGKGEYE